MDLSRLSLRTITDQYLTHLESVRFQDLETAGSFMVMAATLIYLKSKLLLPANPDDPDEVLDEEGELLKRELEERLREYARVKALGGWLAEREAEQTLIYGRTTARAAAAGGHPARGSVGAPAPARDAAAHRGPEAPGAAAGRAQPALGAGAHERDPRRCCAARGRCSSPRWRARERLRAEWVVTLLALLELVRLGQARARQAELFGEIVIERNAVSVRDRPAGGGGRGARPTPTRASSEHRRSLVRPMPAGRARRRDAPTGRRTRTERGTPECLSPSTSSKPCSSPPTPRWRPSASRRCSISSRAAAARELVEGLRARLTPRAAPCR